MRVDVRPTDLRRIPQAGEAYEIVEIATDRGTTVCRYYEAQGARSGVVMVGGTGGGFDTPARGGLYPRLAQDLPNDRISALRVQYRHPTDLVESVFDTVLGLRYLESRGGVAAAGGWSGTRSGGEQ
ncbi:hypothetical protein [Methanoculleus chikugoensis]|uniref:hypothetical protein n=1 Tax=Methanoculleus chikugoensis TaxID=118126 RepID=UPI001FB1BBF6|nr:hypothetical protein [Methanoculleus chikugoensis]